MKRASFVRALGALCAALGIRPAFAALQRKIYLASYSHVDASWRWPLQEGLQQSDATFRSVLRTLDAFPDLRFSETSGAYYRWVRTTDPVTFMRVQEMVTRGKWEPVGGWWTEPDLNLVSGESLMRQAYFGRREFEASFGHRSRIAFLPDSFGSSANLPTILNAQGMLAFVPGRGRFVQSDLPIGRFLWRGLGDASIVTYFNPVTGGEDAPIKTVESALATAFSEDPLVWFGLGDHGGGPSREAVAALEQYLRRNPEKSVVFSRFEPYFKKLPPPTAKRSGEFEGIFVGAYANANLMKLSNKEAERALIDAERFDVLSSLLTGARSRINLDEQWESVLLNQHHDTITGMSLRESLDESTRSNNASEQSAREQTTRVLEGVVDLISHTDSSADMVAVFNPLSVAIKTVIEYPFALNGSPDTAHDLDYTAYNAFLGPSGEDIPFQVAHADRSAHPGALRPVLLSVQIPAMGYTTVRRRTASRAARQAPALQAGQIQNEFLIVTIDPRTGQPVRILDRSTNKYAQISTGELRVYDDTDDTYASKGLDLVPAATYGTFTATKMELIERGPVRQVIRVHSTFGISAIAQDWVLHAGSPLLETTLRVMWHEPQKRLMLVFPHSMYGPARYDIPFGTVERFLRPDAHPALSYVAFPAGAPGLALFGHALNAFWATGELLAINLIRSAPYAATELRAESYSAEDVQGMGNHELHCALYLGEPAPMTLWALSEGFRRRFPVQWVGVHDGRLPLSAGLLELDPRTAVASARRTADGIVVRLHDVSGAAHDASLRLGSVKWNGAIDRYGIATVHLAGHARLMTDEL